MNTSERVTFGLIFGALGGFFGWLIVDPALSLVHDIQKDASGHWIQTAVTPAQDLLFFALVAICIVLGLAFADALRSGSKKGFWRDAGIGAGVALCAGILGDRLGNQFFSMVLGMSLQDAYANMSHDFTILPRLIIGRAIGWMIVGGFLGLSGGIARSSAQKMKLGFLGGLVGGFLGGLVFEPAGLLFGSGMVSRMLSLTVIGGFIGGSVALVEDLFKHAWVIVLVGRNEGRQVILSKPVSTVGRDELSDIGVFGDRSVAMHHADIVKESGHYEVIDQSNGLGLSVNRKPVLKQILRDGDVIQMGGKQLEFHEKSSRHPIELPAEEIPETPVAQTPLPSNICPYCGQPKDPVTGACACSVPAEPTAGVTGNVLQTGTRVTALAGPYAGQSFSLSGGILRIGREEGREICLSSDGTISRRHATLQISGGKAILQDEGSSNGTYVNGVRVTQKDLIPGDVIQIGSSQFRYE